MTVIAEAERDLEGLRRRLAPWFSARWAAGADLTLGEFDSFASGGLSNETLRAPLTWESDGHVHRQDVVVRLPPAGGGVFRDYDLEREGRVQNVLAQQGLSTVSPVIVETDPAIAGAPFIVMPFVAGRTPESQPPYAARGWVADLDPHAQRRVMENFTELLAGIHRVDWQAAGTGFLARAGGTGLRAEFDWWDDLREWLSAAAVPSDAEMVLTTMEWCLEHWPSDRPPDSVVWGDARLGNTIYDDALGVAAIVDWEMAAVAPAEVDLGYHLAHRHNLVNQLGRADQLPELPGFPTEDEQVALYSARLGRPVSDLPWYLIFGAARLGVCRLGVLRAARRAGRALPAGAPIRPWAWQAMAEHRGS
jgi:aminoglycoside phosphotransferase (APT) family kinase protein